jgi:SAM-dependent methyltransferase
MTTSETPELRLNLGAGNVRLPGYASVDRYAADADIRADLFVLPWAWADGSVEAVAMHHFLEHVWDVGGTLREVHRILRPGGEFWVKVPHYRAIYGMAMAHRSMWSWAKVADIGWADDCFAGAPYRFRRMSQRFRFTVKMTKRRVPWVMVPLLEWAANVNPWAWEWLGMPCDEMEWRGVKANEQVRRDSVAPGESNGH